MGAKRTITHVVDGGIIEKETGGLGGSRHILTISYGRRIANILLDIGGTQLRSDTPTEAFDPLRHIDIQNLDAVIVSHVHQDHNGDVVHLTKGGFDKSIIMTDVSKSLTDIITRDNLKTQGEEKSIYNKRLKDEWDNIQKAVWSIWFHHGVKKTRHKKMDAQHLYTLQEAQRFLQSRKIDINKIKTEQQLFKLKPASWKKKEFNEHDISVMLEHIQTIPYNIDHTISTKYSNFMKTKFYDAGHVEGSAQILLKIIGNIHKPKQTFNMLYTGDIGRSKQPGKAGRPEIPTERIDYLVIESTYGDRIHIDREIEKERMFEQLSSARGLTIIACFAVERFQELRSYLKEGVESGKLKLADGEYIYCQSNLAYDISKEYLARDMQNKQDHLRNHTYFKWITDQDQKNAIIGGKGRRIILCTGGMLENGSIMGYLHNATQSKYAKIITTGFQAPGTIGSKLMHNDFSQPIVVNDKPITNNKASFHNFSFSSHADQEELLAYIKSLKLADHVQIALVHGGVQRYPLAQKITEYLEQRDQHKRKEHRGKWQIHVPERNGTAITVKEPQRIHL